MTEWRDIPGYEGHYQASSDGRIKSLERRGPKSGRQLWERILRASTSESHPHPCVVVYAPDGSHRTVTVHRLVAFTFLGPPPPNHEVCHGDGDPANNNVENLRWGTRAENIYDAVRHGTQYWVAKTHCINGHEYTPENTRHYPSSHTPGRTFRRCITCERDQGRIRARKRAAALKQSKAA